MTDTITKFENSKVWRAYPVCIMLSNNHNLLARYMQYLNIFLCFHLPMISVLPVHEGRPPEEIPRFHLE